MQKKMLNKLILFLTIFVFWGCSPRYKIVYDFIPPRDSTAKYQIQKCYQDLKLCNQSCSSQKSSCYQKAVAVAKDEYEKKLKLYKKKLDTYKLEYKNYLSQKEQKDELIEKITYYTDVCDDKKDKYACEKGLEYQYQLKKLKYLHKPRAPREPSLDSIIVDKKASMCDEACPCQEQFRSCYVSAGGQVTTRKICIAHCPDD